MDYRIKIQWIERCGIYVCIEGGWVGWVRDDADSEKYCNEILTRLEGWGGSNVTNNSVLMVCPMRGEYENNALKKLEGWGGEGGHKSNKASAIK